jgi:hypothetical protein
MSDRPPPPDAIARCIQQVRQLQAARMAELYTAGASPHHIEADPTVEALTTALQLIDLAGEHLLRQRPPRTAAEYQRRLGHPPEQDDLHRVNCPDAGKVGHFTCGWCTKHCAPRFMCMCIVHAEVT